MISRYTPGVGICYVGAVSTKTKAKLADKFKRALNPVTLVTCPPKPV